MQPPAAASLFQQRLKYRHARWAVQCSERSPASDYLRDDFEATEMRGEKNHPFAFIDRTLCDMPILHLHQTQHARWVTTPDKRQLEKTLAGFRDRLAKLTDKTCALKMSLHASPIRGRARIDDPARCRAERMHQRQR